MVLMCSGLDPQVENGLGRIGHRKQARGSLVDAHVGGLGGEQYGGEQFERRAPVQLRRRVGVVFAQAGEYLITFMGIHERTGLVAAGGFIAAG